MGGIPQGILAPYIEPAEPFLTGQPAPTGYAPILTGLPAAEKSYNKTLGEIAPDLSNLPASLTGAYQQFQQDRILRGVSPLGQVASQNVLASALTNSEATPAPPAKHGLLNIPSNALHDLQTIVTGLPRLPQALYDTAKTIPELPNQIGTALSSPHPIQALAAVPALSLIPGVHTAADVLSGNFGDIALHPLMTALDVLPAAKELGVGDAIANSAVGDYASRAADAFNGTKAGQALQYAFGPQVRQLGTVYTSVEKMERTADPAFAASQWARPAQEILRDYSDDVIPAERKAALTSRLQLAGPESVLTDPSLSDAERSMVSRVIDATSQQRAYYTQLGDLVQREVNGQSEVFTPQQAKVLDQHRAVGAWSDAVTSIRQQTLAGLAAPTETALTASGLPVTTLTRGPLTDPAALNDLWSSVRPAVDQVSQYIGKGTGKNPSMQMLRGFVNAVTANGKVLPSELRGLINANDVAGATQALDQIDFANLPDQAPTAQEAARAQKWADQNPKFTLTRNQQVQARLNEFELTSRQVLPARFIPKAQDLQNAAAGALLAERISDPAELARAVNLVDEGKYGYETLAQEGLINLDDIRQMQSEVLQRIGDLREQGFDPLFVHHVAPGQESIINYPSPRDYVPTPSATKVRALTFNATPYNQDLTIALAHDAVQALNREGSVEFLRQYLNTDPETSMFARSEGQLAEQYRDAARTLASTDPRYDVSGHLERLIHREWSPVSFASIPDDVKAELGITGDQLGADHPYVPKPVARAFDALMKPPRTFGLWDPVITAYRTALIPLSPRYYLHATIGGLGLLMGETGPSAFSKMGDAADLLRAIKDGTVDQLPERLQPSKTMLAAFGSTKDLPMEWQWRAGNQLGQMGQAVGKTGVGKAFEGLAAKGYDLASMAHDMWRATAYLYGYDKSITKGMTQEAAQAAGEALARRVMMSWDSLTPFERTTVRSIFPFYGFAQHVLRYAFHYPADHPFRTAVVASIARNEANDLQTGLPQSLLSSMFLGHPDANGQVKELMLGSLNPFRDVATMTTLQGWAAATNPVLSTGLDQLGVDTSNGGPVLYPNLKYDPDTGRLAASSTNPALDLLYNTIPQSQIIGQLLNRSSEVKALARQDPNAALRLIESQAGIPVVFKTDNLYQKQFTSELNREKAQQSALKQALVSGNDTEAMRFPQLAQVLPQIRQMQASGQLAAFTPNPAGLGNTVPPTTAALGSLGQQQVAALAGG